MIKETAPVRNAARQLVRELQLLDTRHSIKGFTFSECHLITELQTLGQATASELADILVLEKSTISRLCTKLIDDGYLLSVTDEADKRKKWLKLQARGLRAANRVNHYAQKQVQTALSFVAETDRHALSDGLDRYAKALRYSRLSRAYRIRPIRMSDNAAVARIIREVMTEFGAVGCGYSIEDPEVDDMFAAYPAPRSVFYVITQGQTILGCGGIGPLIGADHNVCELRKMYFKRELRGTGMGTKLLNSCIEQASKIGYKTCYLETLESMAHARHLYQKHGFNPLDAPLGNTGHSACNAWMARDLI